MLFKGSKGVWKMYSIQNGVGYAYNVETKEETKIDMFKFHKLVVLRHVLVLSDTESPKKK